MGTSPRWMVAVAVMAGAGCAPADPACDALCVVARPAFEQCLREWGLSYGDGAGYADAADYDSWCDTWVMEQRLLVATAEDSDPARAALEERCSEQIDTLRAGDCSLYWRLWD